MLSRFTSPLAAAAILFLFWLLLIASAWDKSLTYDELVHAPAGVSYWKFNDYRIQPENGNLPQRIAGLALLGDRFPSPSSRNWLAPGQWELGNEWFHESGNDVPGMLHRGRSVAALQAVALAALVWACARRLFGPTGAMVSLLVCVLNPTLLANGSLMTSDTAAALFFLAATWTWWRLLEAITPGRLALSALASAGLFLSKMSAGLIVPIALILAVIRVLADAPLPVRFRGFQRALAGRARRVGAIAAVGAAQGLLVFIALWGCYGFRYSAIAPDQPSDRGSAPLWEEKLGSTSLAETLDTLGLPAATRQRAQQILDAHHVPLFGWDSNAESAFAELRQGVLTAEQAAAVEARRGAVIDSTPARVVLFAARHRLLPEAYLIGLMHTWRFAQYRYAFFNGRDLSAGSAWFFPYSFAVKTPLPLLGVLGLAGLALWTHRRHPAAAGFGERILRDSIPLWTLVGIYGLSALNARLNIGHRHLLPLYPPLFVLCGAVGPWLQQAIGAGGPAVAGRWIVRAGWAAAALVGLHAVETAARFPHYLAYFNGLVSPANGYRHFVDSSLDWGQDLPGVRDYLRDHPGDRPFHLSYFGNGDPRTYGIEARWLPSNPGWFLSRHEPVQFVPVTSPPAADLAAQLGREFPQHTFVGVGAQAGRSFGVLIRKPETWELTGGTYLISASNLQGVWRPADEAAYQDLRRLVQPFLFPRSPEDAALVRQRGMGDWREILSNYEKGRYRRLAAYLSRYRPDDSIGYSILVFRLTDADLAQALEGPPPFPGPHLERTVSGR